jgi:hypothetical protein
MINKHFSDIAHMIIIFISIISGLSFGVHCGLQAAVIVIYTAFRKPDTFILVISFRGQEFKDGIIRIADGMLLFGRSVIPFRLGQRPGFRLDPTPVVVGIPGI